MPVHPLKQEREARNWSQAHLAELLGVTTRTVARWEQGQTAPYPYYRAQLCTLFGKTAFDLGILPDDGDPPLASTLEQAEGALPVPEHPIPLLYDPMVPRVLGRKQHLVGREDLQALLKQRLCAGERPGMTALNGLPGVGKTALAATLVLDQQVQTFFRDGILWAGIGPQPDVFSVLGRWASLLGAAPPTGIQATQAEEWRQILRAVIGRRRILLVLDDVWSVETALLMQVGGPNCAYLLTTRLPQVAFAFAGQAMLLVQELAEDEGVALLERAVPKLVVEEPEQTRALVRAVGGLPLALKLLAYVLSAQVFTGQPRRVQTTLARLHEASQRLRLSMPTVPEEHPLSLAWDKPLSLQATIAISEQQLSEQARMTLRALGVFPAKPNSFSEEAALAVGQMPPETLDELWDAGLLESQGPERYQVHQTIADYTRAQGQTVETQKRLVRFTRHYLQEHGQDNEALEREWQNLLAALEVAVEVEMPREFIEAMDLLVPFLYRRGRYLLGNQYLHRAYETAIALADTHGQMKMLQHLASFATNLGEAEQAEDYGLRGLELARQLEDLSTQCTLLSTLGLLAYHQGNYSQSIASCERGLELARQLGAARRICFLLNLLIFMACSQGHYVRAQEMAQEGLALARQQGDNASMINMLDSMAHVTHVQGDLAQAEALDREALDLVHQSGHHSAQIQLMNNLASILQERGDHEQAIASLLRALELSRQIGSRLLLCKVLTNVGYALFTEGQHAEAENYLLEGLELARQVKWQGLPGVLTSLGEVVGFQGDYVRANAYFEESVHLAHQMHASVHLSEALASWGDIHVHCQHPDAAVLAYEKVLALADMVDVDPKTTAQARYGLARVAAQRGEITQARQLGLQSLVVFETRSPYKAAEVRQWLRHLEEEV